MENEAIAALKAKEEACRGNLEELGPEKLKEMRDHINPYLEPDEILTDNPE